MKNTMILLVVGSALAVTATVNAVHDFHDDMKDALDDMS